jgi:cell division protein FtsZ
MISHFARTFALEKNKKYENIKLVSVNTDLQALSTIDDKNITVLQIGKKLTRGLGAGMNPEVGRDSALENYDEIKKVMSRF